MSVVRGFGLNGKSLYTNVVTPKEVWLNFVVDHTNSNGLGTKSLKSNGYVEAVFMNTNQTAGKSPGGILNPNPIAGYALVVFKNNFNYYLGGFSGQIPPTTSNSTTSTTAGHVYVITVVGTTTLAQWQAAGLPMGLTPTVGQSFVAIATGAIGGTGTVGLPGVPVANTLNVVGDPNQSIANSNVAANAGSQVLIQFSNYTGSGTISAQTFTGSALATHTHDILFKDAAVADGATTSVNIGTNLMGANTGSNITVAGSGANGGVVAKSAGTPAGTVSAATFTNTSVFTVVAPADSTVIGMQFCFDGSSVTIDGI